MTTLRAFAAEAKDEGFRKHKATCTDDPCPLDVASEIVSYLDRQSLTSTKLVGVLTAVASEYALRLASPKQGAEFANLLGTGVGALCVMMSIRCNP